MSEYITGWRLTRSIYSYCNVCQRFKTGNFWRYFVSQSRATECVCEECAEEVADD